MVCTNEGNADLGTSLPQAAHRLHGNREANSKTRALGVFSAAAGSVGDRPANHDLQLALPRSAAWRRTAYRVGRQRPHANPGERRLPPLAQLHPLRRVYETLPVYRRSGGFSYESTVSGANRSILSPARDARSIKACRMRARCAAPAPTFAGEDRHSSSTTSVEKRDRPPGTSGLDQADGNGVGQLRLSPPLAVPHRRLLARKFMPWMPRFLIYNGTQQMGQATRVAGVSQAELPGDLPFAKRRP